MLNGRPNDHVAAVRARYGATNQNNFFSLADLHHLEILHRHAIAAQVPWHSHVFPNAAWSRTIAHGADPPVRLRTMRGALSMEVMLLHHALKSFSFRPANHIHVIACLKLCDAQIDLAFGKISCQAKLAHKSLRLDPGLLELPKQ